MLYAICGVVVWVHVLMFNVCVPWSWLLLTMCYVVGYDSLAMLCGDCVMPQFVWLCVVCCMGYGLRVMVCVGWCRVHCDCHIFTCLCCMVYGTCRMVCGSCGVVHVVWLMHIVLWFSVYCVCWLLVCIPYELVLLACAYAVCRMMYGYGLRCVCYCVSCIVPCCMRYGLYVIGLWLRV